ncbi:MAG: hypothetical protein LBF78_01635 [Treponema sp.]|jgi:hypothetical protein|nr:hypothetical protein [Treponema sp.]
MKKIFFGLAFFCAALTAHSQRQVSVAVFAFEFSGNGITQDDALSVTAGLTEELQSWGTFNIVSGALADSADYHIKGKLERGDKGMILTAETFNAKTGKSLNTSKESAETPAALMGKLFDFAAQVTENIPFPNYLLGKWRAVIDIPDGPLTCILEFRSNRTVNAEQYDTWERRGDKSLRYQGFGSGTYSYWGHARRTVRGKSVDGFVTLNLNLKDALPKYIAVNFTRLNLNFNEDKSLFELVASGFTCGENVDSSQTISYTRFTKLQ